MNLFQFLQHCMNILARKEDWTFSSTVPTTEVEEFLMKMFQKDPDYWKNMEEQELEHVLVTIENVLSAKENKQRSLALVDLEEMSDYLTVIYVDKIYLSRPERNTNSLFSDFLRLKTKKGITFFCYPSYFEKLPLKIINMLLEFKKIHLAIYDF